MDLYDQWFLLMAKLDKIQALVDNNLTVFREPFFGEMQEFDYKGTNPKLGAVQEKRYRTMSLTHFDTFSYGGIIGGEKPSDYAASITLWNTLFKVQKTPAVFFGFDLPPKLDGDQRISKNQPQFTQFIETARSIGGFYELTVTDPYKEAAFEYVKQHGELSEDARNIGAINHVIFGRDGKLYGHNTDGHGMIRALKQVTPLAGKRMLVIGAGGSVKAITYEALKNNIGHLTVLNRTSERAQELAAHLNKVFPNRPPVHSGSLEEISGDLSDADIVLQSITTGSPITQDMAQRCHPTTIFVDSRYGKKAEFYQLAKQTGHAAEDGLGMIFWQFEKAVRLVSEQGSFVLDDKVLNTVAQKIGYTIKEVVQ